MAVLLRPGLRVRSLACQAELVVVKGVGEFDLRCGGRAMVPADDETPAEAPLAPFDEGTQLGKRYVSSDDRLELLCTKAGAGSLSIGDEPMSMKSAKSLPSSD